MIYTLLISLALLMLLYFILERRREKKKLRASKVERIKKLQPYFLNGKIAMPESSEEIVKEIQKYHALPQSMRCDDDLDIFRIPALLHDLSYNPNINTERMQRILAGYSSKRISPPIVVCDDLWNENDLARKPLSKEELEELSKICEEHIQHLKEKYPDVKMHFGEVLDPQGLLPNRELSTGNREPGACDQ